MTGPDHHAEMEAHYAAGMARQDLAHADAIIADLRTQLAAAQAERDTALELGVRAGLNSAIRGIDATACNVGSACTRRGIQDPETGEVPCEGEEEGGCPCFESLVFAVRAIQNLRASDVGKIVALASAGT